MTGTSQGAKKAAQSRKSTDSTSFKKMGQKGGAQTSSTKQAKKK